MALPYPHGVGAGQIGEAANINTNPITGTTKGMLVGPNDDAVSAQVNRGAYAVNANVDYLYGLLGIDRAVLEVSPFTSAADANRQLTGNIFVGMNTYTDASQAFQVLDADGNELLLDGDRIVVTDVQSPFGVSIFPPAVGAEFVTDPWVIYGYEITGGAATIPAGVDYIVVHGVASDLESAEIDAHVRVPIQHMQEGDVGEAKAFGHSTENAIVGALPVLTFHDRAQAAGGCYMDWTAFWCLVDGRIRYVEAGSSAATGVNNNSSAVYYVDCWGDVQVSSTGATPAPGISSEEYLILGYGSTLVDAWNDTSNCARSLGQKIPYITVGTSTENKVNFEDLQAACDFVGYMYNSTLDTTFFPAIDSSELPRIVIVSGINITATVTLRSPVWIEGVLRHSGFVSGARNPQIFFDIAGGADVIDCNHFTMTAKDLQISYTGAGGGRTGFVFGNVGAHSCFERINGGSDNPALSFGGGFEIEGDSTTVRDCSFTQIGATVGVYLRNTAFGTPNFCVVDHIYLAALAGAAASMLYIDDVTGILVTNSVLNGGAAGIGVMLNASEGVKVRDCTITGVQPLSGGGAALELEVSNCVITGTTPLLATLQAVFKDNVITGGISLSGTAVDITKAVCTGSITVALDGGGHVGVEDCEVTPATHASGYAIQVTLDPGVGITADYLHIRRNKITAVYVAAGPVTYAGVSVLWTSGGVNVEDISDNIITMETDNGAASGFSGILSVSFPASLLRIAGNVIDSTVTGAFAAAASYGIGVVQAGAATCRAEVNNNDVQVEGDSSTTCSWAQVLSRPIGIRLTPGASTSFQAWCRDNKVAMIQYTVAAPPLNETCTGIYISQLDFGLFDGNKVYPAYRGIIAMPEGGAGGDVKITNNDVNFGHCEDADAAAWYDSGVGIVAGMYDGATTSYFISIVMVGNRVRCDGISDAAGERRHCIHGHVDDGAAIIPGLVVFDGNIVIDADDYMSGGSILFHMWQFVEGAVAGAVVGAGQFRPLTGAAVAAGDHNFYQSASIVTTDPN